jgi:hypothetical protein
MAKIIIDIDNKELDFFTKLLQNLKPELIKRIEIQNQYDDNDTLIKFIDDLLVPKKVRKKRVTKKK